MPDSKQNYRWVMLILLWLVYAAIPLVGGALGVLVTPVVNDLQLTHSQMGLVLGSWQFVFIFAAIATGVIIDRWGVRKSILAGIILVVLSAGLRYLANGFATILVAVALYGAGLPMISVGGPTAIASWFKGKRQGMALGFYMTGAWVGTLAALSLTNSVVMPLAQNSWRVTFLYYGAVVLVVGVLWWFLAREKKVELATKRTSPVRTLSQLIRIRNIQLLLIIGLVAQATTHGMGWLPRILETQGMSPAMAGYAVSANTLAGIPAVIILPGVITLGFRSRVLALAALGVALGLGGVIGTSGALQWASLLVMGFAGSAFLPLILRTLMDGSGVPSEYLGSANGVFMSVAQIGGFVAPLIVGALHDATGAFLAGVLLLAALNLIIIPISFRLKPGSSTSDLVQDKKQLVTE